MLLLRPVGWYMVSLCSLWSCDKMVSARFLPCKSGLFPFVINKHFVTGVLRSCYTLSNFQIFIITYNSMWMASYMQFAYTVVDAEKSQYRQLEDWRLSRVDGVNSNLSPGSEAEADSSSNPKTGKQSKWILSSWSFILYRLQLIGQTPHLIPCWGNRSALLSPPIQKISTRNTLPESCW